MIRALTITNLRGIRQGKLEGFTELVVLVGPNSSGKSTVLDSVMLGASPNPNEALNHVVNRRVAFPRNIHWLIFRDRGHQVGPAEILVKSDSQSRLVKLSQVKNAPTGALSIDTKYLVGSSTKSPQWMTGNVPLPDVPEVNMVDPSTNRPLTELYTGVAERGLAKDAKAVITDLLPDVHDIQILLQDGQPSLYLDYKTGGSKPLASAGDGVRLLLQQSLELAAQAGGVVLLEEPEVHMHPGAIRQSARAMIAAMARRVQIILTTHSLELIDALLSEAKTEDLDKISIYRLQLRDGEMKSYRLSGTEASRARSQIEEDLR